MLWGMRPLRIGKVVAVGAALALAFQGACGQDPPAPVFAEDDASVVRPTDAGIDQRVCPGSPGCPPIDAGSDAPSEGGGEGGACVPLNDCNATKDLGRVSGDNNADQVSAQGSTSEWVSVRVTEDSTVLGASLKATFTLVSPPGSNYDLFVYYDPFKDVVVCTPPTAKSTQQAGISDTASIIWGEGGIPNGSDDGRTVNVEVRHVSGTCGGVGKWTLVVQGNK